MNEDIQFNKNKFKENIHYIISKCGFRNNLGRVVLYKLLYFSDFNFYEIYETPITGEKYIRKPKGPIPTHFENAKNELIAENKIKETKELVIDYYKYKYSSLKEPQINFLSRKELDIIDDTINKLSQMNSSSISDYSHGDMPWRVADNNEELDYEYVFYRDPDYSVRTYDDE
jgi:hypothetical protein